MRASSAGSCISQQSSAKQHRVMGIAANVNQYLEIYPIFRMFKGTKLWVYLGLRT